MAAFTLGIQTLVGLLEVGDEVRSGSAPEDFVTIVSRAERPTYVKLGVRRFDGSLDTFRLPATSVVLLAPSMADAVPDDGGQED